MINMRQHITIRLHPLIVVLALAAGALAQANPEWTEPFPPFHIARKCSRL